MVSILDRVVELKSSPMREVIDKRLSEFSYFRSNDVSNEELFCELAFCLMTANFSASGGLKIQNALGKELVILDEKILSRGTAYITDLGMTGPYDSVIGQNKENIINRFLSSMPIRFNVASEDVKLCGAVIDIDGKTGRASQITRLQRPLIKC